MTMRTAPAESDVYRYHLDKIQLGGLGLGGPTLRDMLSYACIIGDDAGMHDDAERAEEFAETCDRYRNLVKSVAHLDLSVAEARKLYDACMSSWSYADQNHYGADDEPDDEARAFGAHGEVVLRALTRPWSALAYSDDGAHGFEKV